MAQKPKGRQCVDKKARHFAKVKVDKTTKPSWMNCNYIHRGAVVWDNTQKKWLWVQMLFCHRCHPKLFPEGLISNGMHESGWHNMLFSWMIYCKLFVLHLRRWTSIKKVVQLLLVHVAWHEWFESSNFWKLSGIENKDARKREWTFYVFVS